MRIRGQEYRVDWGHLVFATLLAGSILWYLLDARAVSLRVNNLLLVQPLAIFALILYLLILPQCFRRVDAASELEPEPADDPLAPALPTEYAALVRVGLLGIALGLFVFFMGAIGFDVAIWLFALATMLICGERRPLPLALYPLAVTGVAVYGFRALMPYPMTTLVL